jgi:hypothetical protein
MLRVILPSLQEVIKQNYTAAITFFYFYYLLLSGALHQIFYRMDCNKTLIITCNSNFTRNNYFTFFWLILEYKGFINIIGNDYFSMLFPWEYKNSMLSNSIVRTTHLTGLFTDLGIELSQLFFIKAEQKVENSIYLRLSIIIFFYWLYL